MAGIETSCSRFGLVPFPVALFPLAGTIGFPGFPCTKVAISNRGMVGRSVTQVTRMVLGAVYWTKGPMARPGPVATIGLMRVSGPAGRLGSSASAWALATAEVVVETVCSGEAFSSPDLRWDSGSP